MSRDVDDDFPVIQYSHGSERPNFPEYSIEAARLRSFEDWPKSMTQKPEKLADAGFFYTLKGDGVICFQCGGDLSQWEKGDDPWIEHALWYGKCKYLLLLKGSEYVNEIKERFGKRSNGKTDESGNPTSSEHSEPEKICSNNKINCSDNSMTLLTNKLKNVTLNETRACRICYTNEYNTAFSPCGHIVACVKCAISQNKCPLCMIPFEKILRIYLP